MSRDPNDLYLKSNTVRKLFNNVYVSEHILLWAPTSYLSRYISNRIKCTTNLSVKGNNYEYTGDVVCTEEHITLTIKSNTQNPDNKMYVDVTLNTDGGNNSSVLHHEFIDSPKSEQIINSQLPANTFKKIPSFVLQISIFWKDTTNLNVPNKLSADFEKLYIGRKLTDVTFVLNNDTEIEAHKSILIARSPVFEAMFQSDMLESKGNPVELKDLDPDIFNDILRYIYTGIMDYSCKDKLVDLMVEADKYALIEFRDYCEKEVIKKMNIVNAADTLLAAHLLNLESLKAKTIEFILNKKQEFFKTDGYKNVIKKHVDLLAELLEKLAESLEKS